MNTTTFRHHYVMLLKKIKWLEQAKKNLEFAGDKITRPNMYHYQVRLYDHQINKYHKMQNNLLSSYGKEVAAAIN